MSGCFECRSCDGRCGGRCSCVCGECWVEPDPRDALAAAGAGSAAYLNEDGSNFESLADYLARIAPHRPKPPVRPGKESALPPSAVESASPGGTGTPDRGRA